MSADKKKPAWQGGLQGANERDDNQNHRLLSTSRTLFDQADRLAATIPYLMTIERKRSTISLLLETWLSALRPSRIDMAGG